MPCSELSQKIKGYLSRYSKWIKAAVVLKIAAAIACVCFFGEIYLLRSPQEKLMNLPPDILILNERHLEKKELTPAQARDEYNKIIFPAIGSIIDHYPIQSIREKFIKITRRVGKKGNEIDLCIEGKIHNSLSSCQKSLTGKMRLIFWMPSWVPFWEHLQKKYAGDEQKIQQLLEDKIIEVVMHEYYHLTEQDYWKKGKDITRQEMTAVEVECYAYTCRELIGPMLEAGRGPCKEDLSYKMNCVFDKCGCDEYHPVWILFIESICDFARYEKPVRSFCSDRNFFYLK